MWYYETKNIYGSKGMKDGSIMVIGIAGGTGSGKTTITRKIMQRFG